MTTLETINNSIFETSVQITFNAAHLDAGTLCGCFFQAAIDAQTQTKATPDIVSLETESDGLRRVVFNNSIAASNMKGRFEKLVSQRMPVDVFEQLDVKYTEETNSYPKPAVA